MVDGLWQGTSSEQARYPARQGRIWQAFLNFRPWARSRLHSRMAKHVNLSTMATRSHSSVGVSQVVSCQSDLALAWDASRPPSDRKRAVYGKSESVRVDIGGRRRIKIKKVTKLIS